MTEIFQAVSGASRWFLPFVLGGAVFMIAAWSEAQLSIAFREDCRQFIVEKRYEPYLGTLPRLVSRAFNWTFGKRQRSIKCFVCAIGFSTSALLVTVLITAFFNPSGLPAFRTFLRAFGWRSIPSVIGLWLLVCVLPSWFTLAKTRFVIWTLQRAQVTLSTLIAIIIIDFIVGSWVYLTVVGSGFAMLGMEEAVRTGKVPADAGVLSMLTSGGLATVIIALLAAALLIPSGQLYLSVPFGNLFWASYASSIWLWLYVLAAIITRSLVHSMPDLRIAGYVLDVDNHPVKAMGLIAGIVVGIVCLVCVAIASVIIRS